MRVGNVFLFIIIEVCIRVQPSQVRALRKEDEDVRGELRRRQAKVAMLTEELDDMTCAVDEVSFFFEYIATTCSLLFPFPGKRLCGFFIERSQACVCRRLLTPVAVKVYTWLKANQGSD